MAVIQLIDHQRQANIVDDILNVFYFFTGDAPNSNANLIELIDTWILTVQPSITLIQSEQIVHLEVSALEVNGIHFASVAQGSVDGQVVGEAFSPYSAYEFIYNRETRLTRNGFKRFAGPVEGDVDQGGNISPGVLVNLNALAVDLGEVVITSWASAVPIIYGRPTPPPPEGSGLPERVNFVENVSFLRFTTQNTRKPWR
jgi:hypothetical protein